MEKERFKKLFPHLSEEMEKGVSRVQIGGGEAPVEERKWAGYDPDIVDFIRRCETVEQALEIIDYVEKRQEITAERAAELRRRLLSEGLRSFGAKKEPDFYHRNV